MFSGATLVGLILLGSTSLYAGFAPTAAEVMASLKGSTLNARDKSLQHKGYYENLDNRSRQSAQLWDLRASKPADWVPLGATPAYRDRSDFLGGELVPNTSITFLGQPFSTNRWGMRDKDRARDKPDRTYRIALLGPSHVMGSGVADDATIAHLLEQRLNEFPPSKAMRFEVLNFGVAAYSLTKQLAQLNDRVFSFEPDAVFVIDSPRLAGPVVQHLADAAARRYDIPFPAVRAALAKTGVAAAGNEGIAVPFDSARRLLRQVGVDTRMPWREAEWRVRRSVDSLIEATFSQMADLARQNGTALAFVALNNVVKPPKAPMPELKAAERAGLLAFNLLDVWRDRDPSELRIAPWDDHPNAAGNRIIAERLAELMQQHADKLNLPKEVRR